MSTYRIVANDMDNRADSRTEKLHSNQWYDYLRTAFRADPVGRRYIRGLALRLKFELGIAFAMASAAFGVMWLAFLGLSCKTVIVAELLCIGFIIWGLWDARQTPVLLARTRAELLKDIRIVGD
jgi:hypothetical protein